MLLQEGASKMRFQPHQINRFVTMCDRPKNGVSGGYVRSTLLPASKNRQFSLVVGKMSDKSIVGFAKGSLYTKVAGVHVPRVAVVDVICAAPNETGVGQIMLKELEAYATARLGARLMLLDSVDDPATIRAYVRAGFQRGMGERTPGTVSQARRRYAKGLRLTFRHATQQYKNALAGEFYPARNTPDQTVVMFKRLSRAQDVTPTKVQWHAWRPGRKALTSAEFRRNAMVSLGTYARNAAGWLREVRR